MLQHVALDGVGGSLDVASTIAQNEEILSSLRNTADEELTAELGALQEESRWMIVAIF